MITIRTYAKIGELLQGQTLKGEPFLISNKSSALFYTTTQLFLGNKNNGLDKKSEQAIRIFSNSLAKSTKHHSFYITQHSNIPKAKGLSSSSTDILGVLSVLNILYKTQYSDQQLYQFAAKIEPTDPCLHTTHLLFNQNSGKIISTVNLPEFCVLYFDSEINKQIDTLQFSPLVCYTDQEKEQLNAIMQTIILGVSSINYTNLFNFATQSARINNRFLPKKNVSLLFDFAQKYSCGVFIAHSGTYMGILIEPDRVATIKPIFGNWVNKNWNTTIYTE